MQGALLKGAAPQPPSRLDEGESGRSDKRMATAGRPWLSDLVEADLPHGS